jgi:hypothetical protein
VRNIIDSKNNNLVTKSNMLIEASYKLGAVEQKIIICLASNIQPTDSDFKTYTLPVKEFHQLLGLKGTPKYTELRQITKDLMQKVFEIRIDKKVAQVAWLSFVAYNETEGTIDIRFDPFLRPYFLKLKKEFTSYKLENIVKLKSSYAIRIYELLKQYERIQERTFHLTDLRKKLGAEDIYPAYGNFKQRVLLPAQKELKKKTDIWFEIEEIKEGRRVEKVKFYINSKRQSKQLGFFEGDIEQIKLPDQFTEKVNRLALEMGFKLSGETLASWNKYGQANVIEILEKIRGRKDIDNPIGYITTVLKASQKITQDDEKISSITDQQDILLYLVSHFRKSKEHLPDWFLKQKAIEEIQKQFNVDEGTAELKFNEVKTELFDVLGRAITESGDIQKEELDKLLGV